MASLVGYTNTCSANSGGGVKFYAAIAADVTSFTLATGLASYDTCTLPTGKVWKEYTFEEDTASIKITGEGAKGATKWTHIAEIDLGKLSIDERGAAQEIADNSPCGLIVLFKDANDVVWVLGYDEKDAASRPMRFESLNGDSKTDLLDPSSSILTLSTAPSGNREHARTFTGVIVTA